MFFYIYFPLFEHWHNDIYNKVIKQSEFKAICK